MFYPTFAILAWVWKYPIKVEHGNIYASRIKYMKSWEDRTFSTSNLENCTGTPPPPKKKADPSCEVGGKKETKIILQDYKNIFILRQETRIILQEYKHIFILRQSPFPIFLECSISP